ncbi:HAD hydrolase-like protein [soil metagenome]
MTSDALRASSQPLAVEHDVALLDLDGVVYVGPHAVAGAVEHLGRARSLGQRLAFVTNNAARTPQAVATHLRELDIALDDADVVTSAQAAARLVAARVPARSRVLVVGGEGLVEALAKHGLTAVHSADDSPAAVVQGFHPSVGWKLLAEGSYAVSAGLPWVASNTDRTVPTARGVAPGNGMLVAAVEEATGLTPLVAGKPEPALIEESVLRTGARSPLMVGDRLDTDISGARRYGMPSLLVLTGVTTVEALLRASGDERPDYVAGDLAGLLVAHPAVRFDGTVSTCAGWTAGVESGRLALRRDQSPAEQPAAAEALAALRACVSTAWLANDADRDTPAPELDISRSVGRLQEMIGAP